MSDPRGKIELTYVRRLPGLDALITEIEASRQQESALLAAIAALLSQRIAEAEEADPDSGYAMNTGFARTTAEVSGAMNMSPMGANHLVAHAEALGTRLPKVAALLADGKTDWAAFDKRLSEMATSMCAKDSRTIGQRRADALLDGRVLTCDCRSRSCASWCDSTISTGTSLPTRTRTWRRRG